MNILYAENIYKKIYKEYKMIENFNGIIYLIIFLMVLVMNIYYGYKCLINTKNFLDKYGLDVACAFFALFADFFTPLCRVAKYKGLF